LWRVLVLVAAAVAAVIFAVLVLHGVHRNGREIGDVLTKLVGFRLTKRKRRKRKGHDGTKEKRITEIAKRRALALALATRSKATLRSPSSLAITSS
jgi:hypothetical protein